ncbi:MAG: transporter associated domain-containing protein, partial [Planctomycetota bacterium]
EQLGHVPTAGDVVDHGGFRFLVTKASNRRAERVLLSPLPPASDANDAAGGA